jgi:predicted nucleic acid-binding protein
MPSFLYDTRFLVEYFFSNEHEHQVRAKDFVAKNRTRYVSVMSLHELYFLELASRGRDVARLRLQAVKDVFRVVDVNSEIAIEASELRHKYRIPMGDSVIAATCRFLGAQCVTDDPHFTQIEEIKTSWAR